MELYDLAYKMTIYATAYAGCALSGFRGADNRQAQNRASVKGAMAIGASRPSIVSAVSRAAIGASV